ncbi:alpha/beta fold hydrolase [Paracoccus alkenifer]|uniref:Lysophospholipase n=1 Tax=Paracoccus alkenifer TaxID=65735 RepID=A0A1H6L8N6_9RHOB|nr:alpha/beta hydrolase [Paracoccus alkenifer]SEH82373.1 lysophospholipase [Paracoccus alkenifer]
MPGTDASPLPFPAAPLHRLPDEPDSGGRAFWTSTSDGLRLRLGLWLPKGAALGRARGTVLLFQGRTEYLEKYGAIAAWLTAQGLAVIAPDWRGQGLSDRLLADRRPGHIGDFADYSADVAAVVSTAESLELARPWHLLAHSMGGCIGLAALLDGLPVARAAFSAPMWGLHHPLVPGGVISTLTATARRLGHSGRAAVGTGGGGNYLLDTRFRGNALTSDARQWARLLAQAGSWPELTLGGATYGWVAAARAEMARLAAMNSPEIPALIGVGGAEAVVSQAAIRRRAASWPQAQLLELPGARHELMFDLSAPQFLAAVEQLFAA